MGFQSFRKKFLKVIEPFRGYGGLSEPKTAEIRPKNRGFAEISAPPNRPFWGGVVEKFSARAKGVPKPSEKFFGDT